MLIFPYIIWKQTVNLRMFPLKDSMSYVLSGMWHVERWFQNEVTELTGGAWTQFTRWMMTMLSQSLNNFIPIIHLPLVRIKWRFRGDNVRQTCSLIAWDYEGKFDVTPDLKLQHINAQLPAFIHCTPPSSAKAALCLHCRTTYALNGLEHEITLIKNSKQNNETVPWKYSYGFSFLRNKMCQPWWRLSVNLLPW